MCTVDARASGDVLLKPKGGAIEFFKALDFFCSRNTLDSYGLMSAVAALGLPLLVVLYLARRLLSAIVFSCLTCEALAVAITSLFSCCKWSDGDLGKVVVDRKLSAGISDETSLTISSHWECLPLLLMRTLYPGLVLPLRPLLESNCSGTFPVLTVLFILARDMF